MKRIAREKKTVEAMAKRYCADEQHGGHRKKLCSTCAELLSYAHERLDRCIFGEGKPTCALCPVHCYQPVRREEITKVMRFAGPKMLFSHPYLAVTHLIDSKKKLSEKVLSYQKKKMWNQELHAKMKADKLKADQRRQR